MTLRGRVIKKLYAAGSKSQHHAICLQTAKGEFKLRLAAADENPFSDPRLNALVGKSIAAHGDLDKVSNQFFVSHWDELPE
jgi:hypothetical protein